MPDFFDYPDYDELQKRPFNTRVDELFGVSEIQGYVSHEQIDYYVPDCEPTQKLRLRVLFNKAGRISDEQMLDEIHNTLWGLHVTGQNLYIQPEGDDKQTPENMIKAMYNFIERNKEKQKLDRDEREA
jgi:hypothetical protein